MFIHSKLFHVYVERGNIGVLEVRVGSFVKYTAVVPPTRVSVSVHSHVLMRFKGKVIIDWEETFIKSNLGELTGKQEGAHSHTYTHTQ